MQLNEHLKLSVDEYEESEQAAYTNRVLPDGDNRTEWVGHGTIAGLAARATYYTTPEDAQMVEDNGGDWGAIDWDAALEKIEIVTDCGTVVVTIYRRRKNQMEGKMKTLKTDLEYVMAGIADARLRGLDPTEMIGRGHGLVMGCPRLAAEAERFLYDEYRHPERYTAVSERLIEWACKACEKSDIKEQ